MSRWQLHVPHRSRDDSRVEVASMARHLEGQDRKTARQLAMDAVIDDGLETAGELLDHLEASGPEQRRLLLHRDRAGAGLESPETVEARERVGAAQHAARLRGSGSSPWQMCGEPTCNAVPLNELGAPVAVDVKRWWCEAHRDQARPGDMQPPSSGIRISESGALVPVDEHEEEREAAKAESRRAELEARLAESEADAVAVRRPEQARQEEVRRLLPPGGSRERALHEAYHAAALCVAGLVPKCVRTDFPGNAFPGDAAGSVDIDWGEGGYRNPAAAKSILVALVLRATTEGCAGGEWETWPVDPAKVAEGARGDALTALELVEHFDMDRVDWCHVLSQAEKLGRRQDFRRLVVRIADELERVEVLTADDLRALMEADREEPTWST